MGELIALDGRSKTTIKERFADWLSTPEPLRVPASQAEFCLQNQITAVTAWRWRQDDRFRALVLGKIRARFAEDIPAVVQAMIDKAKGGDVKAAELVLRHVAQLWHFAGGDQGDGDQPDLADRLVAAVTQSDMGRVLAAQLQAHERARQQAQAVDAEVVEEDSGEEVEGDEQ